MTDLDLWLVLFWLVITPAVVLFAVFVWNLWRWCWRVTVR